MVAVRTKRAEVLNIVCGSWRGTRLLTGITGNQENIIPLGSPHVCPLQCRCVPQKAASLGVACSDYVKGVITLDVFIEQAFKGAHGNLNECASNEKGPNE